MRHHHLSLFILVGIFLSFLPFIALVFFMDFHGRDDYVWAVILRDGFYNFFHFSYWQSSGRYTVILTGYFINPLHFGIENGVIPLQVYTSFILFMFVLGLYFLLKNITFGLPNFSNKNIFLLSSIIAVFFLNNIFLSHFLYWFVGCNAYFVPTIFCLFFWGQLAKCMLNNGAHFKIIPHTPLQKGFEMHPNNEPKNKDYLILYGLNVLVVGCHELLLFVHFSLLGYICLHCFLTKSVKKGLIVKLLVISLIASLFVVFSPGNFNRMSGIENTFNIPSQPQRYAYKPIWKIILLAGYFTICNIGNWLNHATLWLIMLITIPYMYALEKKYSWRSTYLLHPLLHSVLILLLFFILTIFTIKANHYYAERVQSFMFILFTISLFFYLQIWVSYTYNLYEKYNNIHRLHTETNIFNYLKILLIILFLFPSNYNINNAYYECVLVAPKLAKFNKDRLQTIIKAKKSGKTHLKVLLTPPVLRSKFLLPDDFGLENIYFNKSVANYFGLESIKGIP